MAQLEVLTDFDAAEAAITRLAEGEDNELQLLQLPGGVLRFAEVAFAGIKSSELFAKKVDREPAGRGPHFDVYSQLIDTAYPYIGLYNLSGEATITTTTLSPDMTAAYWERYPQHGAEAHQARRSLGFAALLIAGEQAGTGKLETGTSMLLPQDPDAPIIHDVVPINSKAPGAFIKLVAPRQNIHAIELLEHEGYMPLDTVMTQALGGAVVTPGMSIIKNVPGPVQVVRTRDPRTIRLD